MLVVIAARRRSLPAMLALTAMLAFAPSASAVPFQVGMGQGDYFSPTIAIITQGRNVRWTNNDPSDVHDTVSEQNFWSSELLSYGQTFSRTFNAAGTYKYLCTEHADMTGKVQVKVKATASGRRFTVSVSALVAPGNFRHVIQRRNPGSSNWVTLNAGTTARSVSYTGPAAGTYSFRAAYKRLSPFAQSNWSPPKTLTVS